MDSVFNDLQQLKDYIYQWQFTENTQYANDLYLALIAYADRAEMEYKLNEWYPTISGTKYIDFIYYQIQGISDGLSYDEAYEQAVTTWSGQEYPTETDVLSYP